MNIASKVERLLEGLLAYEPEKVIHFGSTARGDFDEHSDIDIIVIKRTDTRFVQRLVEIGKFIPPDISADVFVYTPDEIMAMIDEGNPFIEQALAQGKTIYEKTS
ncbi:MAG: nucleotidyltransferase domain-containing protein [Chloroflexi bacterium]|nr:nucleotidyltransferase domain-containing protein [Chloroflexota bacterium]